MMVPGKKKLKKKKKKKTCGHKHDPEQTLAKVSRKLQRPGDFRLNAQPWSYIKIRKKKLFLILMKPFEFSEIHLQVQ